MASSPIHRILAPVDLSSCSRNSLEFACKLAATCGASVEVLFVSGALAPPPTATNGADASELHRFVKSVPGTSGVPLSEHVEAGDARERIVALAEGFDAIVLGTHGRTGRTRSLAGSIAEGVVRTAPCPVVTVREPR
jgi:nucleotide-binding universal stress UspA family protein